MVSNIASRHLPPSDLSFCTMLSDNSSDTGSDTGDVTLPPDQSLRISTLQDTFVILSVSDSGLLVGEDTPYEDFTSFESGAYIFAEGIAFTSSVQSPNGLTIVADSITSSLDVNLSSAGLSGEDQSNPTVPAESGQPAGSLNFYLQRGTDENAQHLSFVASGGNGGRTIVAGAQGGNGGDGGSVVRVFQSLYSTPFKAFAAFLTRSDVSSSNASLDGPVLPTDSPFLAALDLSAYPTDDMALSVVTAMQNLRDMLKAIGSGESHTLRQLVVSAKGVRNALVVGTESQGVHSFLPAVDCAGGYPGAGKDVQGKDGSWGKPGTDYPLLLPQHDALYNPGDDPASLKKVPFAFAHPDQCAMLLTRAETFYYMGSPILMQGAADMFRRIIDRLSFLPLEKDDPLYKAYTSSFIMPNGALDTLQSIRTEATNQLTHLLSGVVSLPIRVYDIC